MTSPNAYSPQLGNLCDTPEIPGHREAWLNAAKRAEEKETANQRERDLP